MQFFITYISRCLRTQTIQPYYQEQDTKDHTTIPLAVEALIAGLIFWGETII